MTVFVVLNFKESNIAACRKGDNHFTQQGAFWGGLAASEGKVLEGFDAFPNGLKCLSGCSEDAFRFVKEIFSGKILSCPPSSSSGCAPGEF